MPWTFIVITVGLLLAACGVSDGTPPIGPGTTMHKQSPAIEVIAPSSPLQGLTGSLVFSDLEPLTQALAPVGDERIFFVEKAGRMLVARDGTIKREPFLDISHEVLSEGNEQGLLTVAFHPQFHDNGRVFLTYTDMEGDLRLVEYRVSAGNDDRVDPDSGRDVLVVAQPHQYHQSGSLVFGPDGYIWMSIGDGGATRGPIHDPQDLTLILSSIVRLDVDYAEPYAIPPDNPFVDTAPPQALLEIWAYGLRNPWRITIDPQTRLLYIPDVGAGSIEEVNVVTLSDAGLNFGWPITEGSECFDAQSCDTSGLVMPVYEYEHERGCAIVGGPVYAGASMPELHGSYFFGDHCLGWVNSFTYDTDEGVGEVVDWEEDLGKLGNITSIDTDGRGEILVSNLDGEVWRLEPVR